MEQSPPTGLFPTLNRPLRPTIALIMVLVAISGLFLGLTRYRLQTQANRAHLAKLHAERIQAEKQAALSVPLPVYTGGVAK